MNRFFKIIFIGFLLTLSSVFSQEIKEREREFTVKIQVVDENTRQQIKDARVTVNGRVFKFSNTKARYLVEVN